MRKKKIKMKLIKLTLDILYISSITICMYWVYIGFQINLLAGFLMIIAIICVYYIWHEEIKKFNLINKKE